MAQNLEIHFRGSRKSSGHKRRIEIAVKISVREIDRVRPPANCNNLTSRKNTHVSGGRTAVTGRHNNPLAPFIYSEPRGRLAPLRAAYVRTAQVSVRTEGKFCVVMRAGLCEK